MEKLYHTNLVNKYFKELIISGQSYRQDIISNIDYYIFKHDKFIPVVKRKNIKNRSYYEILLNFQYNPDNLYKLLIRNCGTLYHMKYFNIDSLINEFCINDKRYYYNNFHNELTNFLKHIGYNNLNDWKKLLEYFPFECITVAPKNIEIQKIAIDIHIGYMEHILNPSDEIINYALSKCTKYQKLIINKTIKPIHYEKKDYSDESLYDQCYLSEKMANRLLYSTKFALKYILKYYNYEIEFIEIIARNSGGVIFATRSEILNMVS